MQLQKIHLLFSFICVCSTRALPAKQERLNFIINLRRSEVDDGIANLRFKELREPANKKFLPFVSSTHSKAFNFLRLDESPQVTSETMKNE